MTKNNRKSVSITIPLPMLIGLALALVVFVTGLNARSLITAASNTIQLV